MCLGGPVVECQVCDSKVPGSNPAQNRILAIFLCLSQSLPPPLPECSQCKPQVKVNTSEHQIPLHLFPSSMAYIMTFCLFFSVLLLTN